MWMKTYEKTFKDLDKNRIWSIWTDINNWPSWHGDLEYCTLQGPFAVGNYFILKPKGAVPAVKISLVQIIEDQEFRDCTHFFGAKMYATHKMESTKDGLCLSNKLVVKGPLKWLWIFLVARKVASSIPEEMDALVRLARKNER